MQTIRLIFTKRPKNPISWLIRWAIPQSRFLMARSSHCFVVDDKHAIEAHMVYGVRHVPLSVALEGAVIVAECSYPVSDAERGLSWARSQVCLYEPNLPAWLPKFVRFPLEVFLRMKNNNYDFAGAFALPLEPNRDWEDPSLWHCYEFGAKTIKEAGFDAFSDSHFVTELALFAVKQQPVASCASAS